MRFNPITILSTIELTVNEGENHTDYRSGSNSPGSEGRITITFNFEHDKIDSMNGTDEWEINIYLENCGDQKPPADVAGLRDVVDDSNDYSLMMSTMVYRPK